ncbi:MAG: NAD(P)/FAD-dependent oxidoreductase, partial [Desulfobacterales bacterium]|nr:NAD(P)/FAD-dependent oxidoreductase [Desulfobacterales bacterium]
MGELEQEAEVLVIGSGPGGYAAAFRAADMGLDVTMVDPARRPGGVCLYKGCIPSKTFLFLSELIHDAARAERMGISFGKPRIDLNALRDWKGKVIDSMADGLVSLSNRRGVQLLRGRAQFESSHTARIYDCEVSRIKFRHAIVATGSRPIAFPGIEFKSGGRIMSSTGALALADVPPTLLIIGGGYVGLELGMVYAALGSRVSLVELEDRLLAGVDADLVKPLHQRLNTLFKTIGLQTKVASMKADESGVDVILEGKVEKAEQRFDRVLVAIGRNARSRDIGLENTNVEFDETGFIKVDDQQRTADKRI